MCYYEMENWQQVAEWSEAFALCPCGRRFKSCLTFLRRLLLLAHAVPIDGLSSGKVILEMESQWRIYWIIENIESM